MTPSQAKIDSLNHPLSNMRGVVVTEAGIALVAQHERIDEQRRLIAALTADRDARVKELTQARLWLADARDDVNDLHARLVNSRSHSLVDSWLCAAGCVAVGLFTGWLMWGGGGL